MTRERYPSRTMRRPEAAPNRPLPPVDTGAVPPAVLRNRISISIAHTPHGLQPCPYHETLKRLWPTQGEALSLVSRPRLRPQGDCGIPKVTHHLLPPLYSRTWAAPILSAAPVDPSSSVEVWGRLAILALPQMSGRGPASLLNTQRYAQRWDGAPPPGKSAEPTVVKREPTEPSPFPQILQRSAYDRPWELSHAAHTTPATPGLQRI
jgi:hypothetical protein